MVELSRRDLLKTAGPGGLAAVAGCLDGSSNPDTGVPDSTGTDTAERDQDTPTTNGDGTADDADGSDTESVVNMESFLEALSFLPAPDTVDDFADQDWEVTYLDKEYVNNHPNSAGLAPMNDLVGQTAEKVLLYDPIHSRGIRFLSHEWPEAVDIENMSAAGLEDTGEQGEFRTLEAEIEQAGATFYNTTGVDGDGTIATYSRDSLSDARSHYQQMLNAGSGSGDFRSDVAPDMQKLLEAVDSGREHVTISAGVEITTTTRRDPWHR